MWTGFNPPPAVRPGETGPRSPVCPSTQFQSAPGGEAGGKTVATAAVSPASCFNPPPAVRPGETDAAGPAGDDPVLFQSAPGAEAGGNTAAGGRLLHVFQSAPGGEAGGNQGRQDVSIPPPAVRPGETMGSLEGVSIRSRR